MNTIFFGAPEFGLESLRALLGSRHKVIAVVSQPDRPKGRSGKPVPTAVSALAQSSGIPVLCPVNVKEKETVAELEKMGADIFVVAAYGQFLNKRLLTMPRFGAINVHASLLPKYRGASPVQAAILNGDDVTGISIMQMDRGMDTGDVLYAEQISVSAEDTGGSLTAKLGVLGGKALLAALDLISCGQAVPTPQNNEEATYAPLLTREMGVIDFNAPAVLVHNKVRAFDPWPGAVAEINGVVLKIWRTGLSDRRHETTPGTVIVGRELAPAATQGISVACGNGEVIDLLTVQAAGGKRLPVAEYLKGQKDTLDILPQKHTKIT